MFLEEIHSNREIKKNGKMKFFQGHKTRMGESDEIAPSSLSFDMFDIAIKYSSNCTLLPPKKKEKKGGMH